MLIEKQNSSSFVNTQGQETSDFTARRRFRVGLNTLKMWNERVKLLHHDVGTDIITCYYVYLTSIDPRKANFIIKFLKDMKIDKINRQDQLQEIMSDISDLFFISGKNSGYKTWRYFVGMNLFSDYKNGTSKELDLYMRNWFLTGNTYIDTTILSESEWYDRFTLGVRRAIRKNVKYKTTRASWEEVIASKFLNYGNTGASNLNNAGYKHSKWSTVLNSDIEKIIEQIREKESMTSKIFFKREIKKVRGVANPDFISSLVFEILLDNIYESNDESDFAFQQSQAQKRKIDKEISNLLKQHKIFMPLDQSKFDHQITLKMQAIVYNELMIFKKNYVIPQFVDSYDYIRKKIIQMIYNHTMISPISEIKIKKGLPSGVRTTILLDTIISAALLDMAETLSGVTVRLRRLQGDDVDFAVDTDLEAYKINKAYNIIGVVANVSKNKIDTTETEFLRTINNIDSKNNYPARLIHSLIVKNPAKEYTKTRLEELSGSVSTWVKFINRGAEYKHVLDKVIQDVSGITSLTYAKAKLLLLTSKDLGGMGFNDENKILRYKIETIIENDIEKYNTKKREYKKLIAKFKERNAKYIFLANNIDYNILEEHVMDISITKKYRWKFCAINKIDITKLQPLYANMANIYDDYVRNYFKFGKNNIGLYKDRKLPQVYIKQHRSDQVINKLAMNTIRSVAYKYNKKRKREFEFEANIKVRINTGDFNKNKFTKAALELISDQDFKFNSSINYSDSVLSYWYADLMTYILYKLQFVMHRISVGVINAVNDMLMYCKYSEIKRFSIFGLESG